MLLFRLPRRDLLTLRTSGGLLQRAEHAARLSVVAIALATVFVIWTVVVAVDRNDKNVFPPVLPAVLAIATLGASALFVFARRSGIAFN